MNNENLDPEPESRFRRYANWSIVIGTGLGTSYFLGFLVYHSLVPVSTINNWFLQILEKHYAACIGVPMSAIAAFCVVLLLKVVSIGSIEIEALGFKFRGASGPVVYGFFVFWRLTHQSIICPTKDTFQKLLTYGETHARFH